MDNEAKDTKNKPDFSLIPVEIMYDIEKVRQYGVQKYKEPDNWKQVPVKEYYKALYRHVIKIMQGEKIDPESKLSHIAHVACNVAFILELEKNK